MIDDVLMWCIQMMYSEEEEEDDDDDDDAQYIVFYTEIKVYDIHLMM